MRKHGFAPIVQIMDIGPKILVYDNGAKCAFCEKEISYDKVRIKNFPIQEASCPEGTQVGLFERLVSKFTGKLNCDFDATLDW